MAVTVVVMVMFAICGIVKRYHFCENTEQPVWRLMDLVKMGPHFEPIPTEEGKISERLDRELVFHRFEHAFFALFTKSNWKALSSLFLEPRECDALLFPSFFHFNFIRCCVLTPGTETNSGSDGIIISSCDNRWVVLRQTAQAKIKMTEWRQTSEWNNNNGGKNAKKRSEFGKDQSRTHAPASKWEKCKLFLYFISFFVRSRIQFDIETFLLIDPYRHNKCCSTTFPQFSGRLLPHTSQSVEPNEHLQKF